MELSFLLTINFDLALKPSDYARYYFVLQSYRQGPLSLIPLDKKLVLQLQEKALGRSESAKIQHIHARRCSSLEPSSSPMPFFRPISLEEIQMTPYSPLSSEKLSPNF
eukprot:TRINITY_DN3845_c0_g1_i1.p1 TRINITY_DN3845_c0_g1~~TRINITY_DN3845_c0_g1_i1.p1  ORF type:complete len:108 (-),score=6.70 TRINITY_DN3845_c0_g1_i1:167-490(-)